MSNTETPTGISSDSDTDTDTPRYAPEWLALREGADAAARAPGLLGPLRAHWADRRADQRADQPLLATEWVIRDLGCGTGSMGRWLAPRLPGPQRWILHDHDPDLLVRAAASMPRAADDGSRVTAATERGDIARLVSAGLAGTSLVTASALLDLLTRDELDALAAACAGAGCPALLALSVAGRVDITPAETLDAEIAEAFDAHQRRVVHGRRLLGPDAVEAASDAFARHRMEVQVRASPWRLGPGDSALTAQWLRGWVGAAVEQRPDLAPRAEAYVARRLTDCEDGGVTAVVHHNDLLALPGGSPAGPTGGAW
ncbi:SAM-dependent methyltransferase [Streptomyces sp. NPDC088258]|uniref:class I SAM-dependent methyltransferase n=1 Tax=Streptomyces sp. NPDC088258 TaxID=3365849 RepID=UPI0037F6020C